MRNWKLLQFGFLGIEYFTVRGISQSPYQGGIQLGIQMDIQLVFKWDLDMQLFICITFDPTQPQPSAAQPSPEPRAQPSPAQPSRALPRPAPPRSPARQLSGFVSLILFLFWTFFFCHMSSHFLKSALWFGFNSCYCCGFAARHRVCWVYICFALDGIAQLPSLSCGFSSPCRCTSGVCVSLLPLRCAIVIFSMPPCVSA